MRSLEVRLISVFCLAVLLQPIPVFAGHPEPGLELSRDTMSHRVVKVGEKITGSFDWQMYSGENQPGNPVWVIVCGWRDSSNDWLTPEPAIIYCGTPGHFPGCRQTYSISIEAPAEASNYSLWVSAIPTDKEDEAIRIFKDSVPSSETKTQVKLPGSFLVEGDPKRISRPKPTSQDKPMQPSRSPEPTLLKKVLDGLGITGNNDRNRKKRWWLPSR